MLYNFLRNELDDHAHILEPVKGGAKVKVLTSAVMYIAPSVLITLFHITFDEVRSAVRVVNSKG